MNEMEIIVVDSCSQQNEGRIVAEYQKHFPNIFYQRTNQRETLYKAWNRGILRARGKYLTNANTDDRHRDDAFERMAEQLEAHPTVALVYSDQAVSLVENELFEDCSHARTLPAPDFDKRQLLFRCYVGSQPMWRRAIHDKVGLFDAKYTRAGDYEFWLRAAQIWDFIHIPECLGTFFDSPDRLTRSNQDLSNVESVRARLTHLPAWVEMYGKGIRKELAIEAYGLGKLNAVAGRPWRAKPLLRIAQRLDPFNWRYYKTYFFRTVLKLRWGFWQKPKIPERSTIPRV